MSNQYLKLRRSGVPGKIPTTESIDFGEIALNTFDGVAYMKRSGSNGEEVVGFNSGSFSGSFQGTFTGDGSGLTNLPTQSFSTGSLLTTASFNAFTASYNTGSFTGQFSGSFSGSGANLFGIPASGIVGLNLSQISSGSYSASISEAGLLINNRVVAPSFTGSLYGTASWANNAISSSYALSASHASTASYVNTLYQNVTIVGNQILSGTLDVLVPAGAASGQNENPTSNNIFWSYVPQDTNTTAVRTGWTASVQGGGTYTVTNVQVDTPFPPFIAITLSDPSLTLPYRAIINFSSTSKHWKFNSDGTTDMPGDVRITGSLTATNGITGSLHGTASWALNALTASFVTASNVHGPYGANSILSASYAVSSSFAAFAESASYALDASNALTSSHALTASHVNTLNQNVTVVGNQTISGSLTVRDNLIVLGSASIQYISESTLNIGTNLITVNTFGGSVRFGGLAVIDSGSSPLHSGSFLFDSVKNQFIFVHQTTPITSSVFLLGPETYNDLGNEAYLTQNRLPKGSGIEHLYDSNISDDGSIVSINSNTQVTGSLVVSQGITGSLFGTASWAINALTASRLTPLPLNLTNPPSNGDLLIYDSGTSAWENSKILSGSYELSGSFTTVGANIVCGSLIITDNSIISGSLFIGNNLTVIGSSTLVNLTSSQLDLGTGILEFTTFAPATTYGGIAVKDSGSQAPLSSSLIYNVIGRDWIVTEDRGTGITSSLMLLGPQTFGNQGNETPLTLNRLPKGTGTQHLNDSNISDNGSIITISSSTQITGSLAVSGLSAGTGSSHVIMYNTASGQFFFTASSAIGGGNASNDNFQQIFLLMGG